MKVIELLNKIANGEIPKKIKIDNDLYTHNGIDYKRESDGEYLFGVFLETTTEDFNREVEIIEEDKKIEEIEYHHQYDECWVKDKFYKDQKGNLVDEIIIDKVNELIKAINEMEENK